MSDFAYICDYYGVPAKRGAVIEYEGKRGVVTGTHGPHIKAKAKLPDALPTMTRIGGY